MTGATANKIIMMCAANYPNHGEDLKAKSILWMQTFINKDDGLMETAIISCLDYCKKFPTIADIREAIKDLQYVENTKPKLLTREIPKNELLYKNIMDIASGKVSAKDQLNSIDITEMMKYVKNHIPDVTEEIIRRSIPEIMNCMQSENMCFECRVSKQACGQIIVKPMLDDYGYVVNRNIKCNKQIRS